jgi:hypothetical protein
MKRMLEYDLEITSRSASNKEVECVWCNFCVYFGKEGRSVPFERTRKLTENVKYFTKPFRIDNYKSHLKNHSEKWEEYKRCLIDEKKSFFCQKQKIINTLFSHYNVDRESVCFCIDACIVEKLKRKCCLTKEMTTIRLAKEEL